MEKNWMTLINYLEGKYENITPEILDTVAYICMQCPWGKRTLL